jgi:hypothetical protein
MVPDHVQQMKADNQLCLSVKGRELKAEQKLLREILKTIQVFVVMQAKGFEALSYPCSCMRVAQPIALVPSKTKPGKVMRWHLSDTLVDQPCYSEYCRSQPSSFRIYSPFYHN